jgi:transcriptional regulator with XRE-family HTH domain
MRIDHMKMKEARLKKGWNQMQLALHSGISVYTISRIETGRRSPKNPQPVKRLAETLGLSFRSLILREPEDDAGPVVVGVGAGEDRP